MNPKEPSAAEEIKRLRRTLPAGVVEALQTMLTAAQQFGSASGRNASHDVCEARLEAQRAAEHSLLVLLKAELKKRYETGIEQGRASGVAS